MQEYSSVNKLVIVTLALLLAISLVTLAAELVKYNQTVYQHKTECQGGVKIMQDPPNNGVKMLAVLTILAILISAVFITVYLVRRSHGVKSSSNVMQYDSTR